MSNNKIYYQIWDKLDAVLPEFQFSKRGNKWISTNTLHLSGEPGQHGKHKVSVCKYKPYAIGDFRGNVTNIPNYLIGSAFHSKISDFKSSLSYLRSFLEHTDNSVEFINQYSSKIIRPKLVEIPLPFLEETIKDFRNNNFVLFLIDLFGEQRAITLIKRFYIGSSHFWANSTVFWYINQKQIILGGQVVQFDRAGNTIKFINYRGEEDRKNRPIYMASEKQYQKQEETIPEWVKSHKYGYGKNKIQVPKYPCLFGLHQLSNEPKDKIIAIVESPKTAIISAGYFPQYIWMALGAMNWWGNGDKLLPLLNRKIILFPDNGKAYKAWLIKAKQFQHLAEIVVSDLLKNKDIIPNSDLADYLVKHNWKDFQFGEF